MKELRYYLKPIKGYNFLNIFHSSIFRRSPLRDRASTLATKVLRIRPSFKKKNVSLSYPSKGDLLSLTDTVFFYQT